MANSPNLGVDLYALWKAGKDNYPSVADEYSAASFAIEAIETGLGFAFWRPDVFGGGTYGPVYPQWRGLRDDLLQIIRQSESNLRDTAEALCMAVKTYTTTDDEAAAAFQKIRDSRGEPRPGGAQ